MLAGSSIGDFRACTTMQSAEERARTTHGTTKVPLEHKICTLPEVIVHLAPRKLKVPTSLWFTIGKALEMSTLVTISVAELQEAVPRPLELRCIPAKMTMKMTTLLEVGHVPPP